MTNKPERSVEEEVVRLTRIAHPYDQGKPTSQLEDELRKTLQAERQKREEMVELEREYVNAYATFVDEMSVDTPLNVAFESLNEKLSIIFDKYEATQPPTPLTNDKE